MAEEKSNQQVSVELRRAVKSGVAFLQGAQFREGVAAVTLDELLAQQIEMIEGGGTTNRLGILEKIEKVRTELRSTTDQIRQLPPESFEGPSEDDDVNTPV